MHKISQHQNGFKGSQQQSRNHGERSQIITGHTYGCKGKRQQGQQNQEKGPVWNDMLFVVVFAHDTLLGDKIKQREKENPDDIHQVPVKAGIFKKGKIIMCDLLLDNIIENKSDEYEADNDMQGM